MKLGWKHGYENRDRDEDRVEDGVTKDRDDNRD